MRGERAVRARPNVKLFYAKKYCLPASLGAINVITRPENYHLSCKYQNKIESVLAMPLYEYKESCSETTVLYDRFKILMNYGDEPS